jgi:hypothetical protein
MTAVTRISDADLELVAAVARREGWSDLAAPPARHGPRSLDEERAVARFCEAAAERAPRPARGGRLRARLAIVAMTLVVLGGCWYVSPTRTAIGLIGAGLFSLVSVRRGRRRRGRGRATGILARQGF